MTISRKLRRSGVQAGTCTAVAALLAGCSGGPVASGRSGELNVLMVNNPQMIHLQKLTADNFTKETGIKVNFTVLPENDVRERISQDFSSQAGQYDIATISNFEVPFFAKNGWLHELDAHVRKDKGFHQRRIFQSLQNSLTVEGKLYAEPFYGESSFLMYRKDVFAKKGLAMPPKPTWQQVARLAAETDGFERGMSGICLRGQPGWGEVIAPLTTVVNTMGGTWFNKDWEPQLTSPEFKRATQFYVDLVREHGEKDAAHSGYTECLNQMRRGKSAMWYDATVGAGSLEAQGSAVRGKIGYAPAPVERTKNSGWLYTWAWGVQKASNKSDQAWKFISWASGEQYEQLVGKKLGWANVPAGKRSSTYEIPGYYNEAAAFSQATLLSIARANPENPGVQLRPTIGIQFVGIPEFTDLGTKVSREINAAIVGRQSVEKALETSQKFAETVATKYQ